MSPQGKIVETGSVLSSYPDFAYDKVRDEGDRKYRTVQACTECRRRKSKCDRTFPCGPCKARNDESSCVEYQKDRPAGYIGYAHLSDFDLLVKRAAELEDLLLAHDREIKSLKRMMGGGNDTIVSQPGPSSVSIDRSESRQPWRREGGADEGLGEESLEIPSYPDPARQRRKVVVQSPNEEGSTVTKALGDLNVDERDSDRPFIHHSRPPSGAPSLADHNAALVLEDMALNRVWNLERETMPRLEMSKDNPDSTGQYTPEGVPQITVYGTDSLPDPATQRFIVDHFMNNIEWLHRCLHRPSFWKRFEAIEDLTFSHPLTIPAALFLALVAAILCAGLHGMDRDSANLIGYDEQTQRFVAKSMAELSERAMNAADWLQNHRLESLQAFIIMGPYYNSVNRSEAHWAMLGSVVHVAHSLSLSRLSRELEPDATPAQIQRQFGRRWLLAAERETGRRVWYSIMELAFTSASDHHFACTTRLEHQLSVPPANIEDEDLVGHGPIIARSSDVHTGMSFFLNRISLMYAAERMINRTIVINKGLKYSTIEEAHRGLLQASADFSPFYVPTAKLQDYAQDAADLARLAAERYVLQCEVRLRLLRTHRIYLPGSFLTSHYALSRRVCEEQSALALGTIHTLPRGVPRTYWPLSQCVLTATIALFCIYFQTADNQAVDNASLLQSGIGWLRENTASVALQRSAAALQIMLDEEATLRYDKRVDPSASRGTKRDVQGRQNADESKMHRLLRKIMTPAHTTQETSPTSFSPLLPSQGQGDVLPASTIDPSLFGDFAPFIQFDMFDGFDGTNRGNPPLGNWQQQTQGEAINPDILEFLGIGLQGTDVPYNLYNPNSNA